jgi:hypothetical protein
VPEAPPPLVAPLEVPPVPELVPPCAPEPPLLGVAVVPPFAPVPEPPAGPVSALVEHAAAPKIPTSATKKRPLRPKLSARSTVMPETIRY